jgi:hypothetical protein
MRWAWRVVCLSLALATTSAAHLRFPTVKAERHVRLRLAEDPIRIDYRIGLGTERAIEVRKLADANRDGKVDTLEGNAALDARTDALLQQLEVCTGANLETVECKRLEKRNVELVAAEGWAPEDDAEHLHLMWTFRLDRRATDIGAIRVSDGYDGDFGVELTDVEIDAPAHAKLSLAGEGGRTAGLAARFSWVEARRAPGPRIVVAAWPAPASSRRRFVVIALAGTAFGALAWWWSRRWQGRTPVR